MMTKDSGFTLIEMLISTAILGIVTAGVVLVLQQNQFSYVNENEQAGLSQEMRLALDQIARFVRQAGNDPMETISGPPLAILGEGHIRLFTDLTGSLPGEDHLTGTGDPDGALNSLYETVTIRHDPWTKSVYVDIGNGEQVVAENIEKLNFTCYDYQGNQTDDPNSISRVNIEIIGNSADLGISSSRHVNSMTLTSDVFIRKKTIQLLEYDTSLEIVGG